ncbi:hypothetical protein HUG10_19930 (plasmid) [Halorarum halophilum]|uniref:Uncharacterized protein n=1 Tax=Halorarum halophilum TaxID=2743090 RepID=A0A7D5KPV5_9EURY|nr:hypothetical protein [Halobaculum halophilum]QLG29882.1 hypothetical protein HUG10_19930 [Halobaculum halophilum]
MKRQGAPLALGQTIEYTVVDVDAHGTERVRLSHEHADEYDVDWYRDQCIRAAVGVLSPAGYHESAIKNSPREGSTPSIQSYE